MEVEADLFLLRCPYTVVRGTFNIAATCATVFSPAFTEGRPLDGNCHRRPDPSHGADHVVTPKARTNFRYRECDPGPNVPALHRHEPRRPKPPCGQSRPRPVDPSDWFEPFEDGRALDPNRGFRHRQLPL